MRLRSLMAPAAAALIGFTSAATAEPITLKLSFYSSDRSEPYLQTVKPFVDAVNGEAKDSLQIQVYFSGALGKDQSQTAQAVLDGKVDIAFVIIGLQPTELFPDTDLLEMPGLFRDTREGTLAFTRLAAAKALRGYENFYVIGAYVTQPETIHTRPPVASLKDLSGLAIGTDNRIEGEALAKLGMRPVLMPLSEFANAIASGRVAGVAKSVSILYDFGITRLATYHYMLGTSGLALALLMNRQEFESLPTQCQDIIRKYSGEWTAARFIDSYRSAESDAIEKLKADSRHQVIIPSPTDQAAAQSAFNSIIAEWADKSPHNSELLAQTEAELRIIRSAP